MKNLFKSKTTKYRELIIDSLRNKKDIEIDSFVQYKAKALLSIAKKHSNDDRYKSIIDKIATIECELDRHNDSFEEHLLSYQLKPILKLTDDDRVKDRYITLFFSKLNKKDYDYLVEKLGE